MKYIAILFSLTFLCNLTFSQINLSQINASVQSSGNTATVSFNTLGNFVNSGESSNIKIFFRMPSSQTSSSTSVSINSSFPFVLTTNIASGSYRYMFFTATFPTAFDLSTWSPNSNYVIGEFTFTNFTGALNVEMYSANQSGGSWNGTSMTKIISGGGNPDNLVSWPVNQTVTLPIKLSSFSATKDGDRSARLDWTSTSEVNSAYFGIERSTDGINWQAIDRVAAAGNSSNRLDYQYFDRNLPISRSNDHIFYYRLQLVDLDGQYKYSDVRGVNFEGIATTDIISLYPNPTTSMVNIDLRDMDIEQGSIHLKLVDMAGRLILNKTINGIGIEPIDVSRYDAGSYQVIVSQGNQQHQKRFIKAN